MEDWRQERDRALLTLKSTRQARPRLEAAETLVHLAEEGTERRAELAGCVPTLMEDADDRVRRMGVALAARTLPEEEAEAFLGARVKDPSYDVRLEAVGQLADLARPTSRGMLAAAMEDERFHVRFEAARGMAALHHSAGLDVLVEALGDEHLRFRALGALAELGDARALPAIQKLHQKWLLPYFDRTQAAGARARLGDPEGARWLVERVAKKRGVDRPLAVELLGEVNAPEAWDRLTAILRDAKDLARGAAARGLGRLGDPRAVPVLVTVLEDPTAPEDVRLDAAEGLCLLGDEAKAAVRRMTEGAADEAFRRELRLMLEEYA